MPQHERHFRIRHMLATGRPVASERLREELGVSASTLKRDIAFLRDRLNVPLIRDTAHRGWRVDLSTQAQGSQHELPGLWFSADEAHALLTMQHLLASLDSGGLLGPQVEPLRRRLAALLGTGAPSPDEVGRRIKVLTLGARRMALPHFQALAGALFQRRRAWLVYRSRTRDEEAEREVSPQRLVHYRDNWYLDAWCHRRQALRSFSLDAMRRVRVLASPVHEVPDHTLDEQLGAGYGIFAGHTVQHARLRFSPQRARWVAAERWHPDQRGRYMPDGHWELDLPYTDHRELVMDILRHVPDVEVLWPETLHEEVLSRLREGLRKMGGLDE